MKEMDRALAYARQRMAQIEESIYVPLAELECETYISDEPRGFEEREQGRREQGAAAEGCAWLHFTGTVPEGAAGWPVVARLELTGDALLVDGSGAPVCGPEDGVIHAPLSEEAHGGERAELWVECRGGVRAGACGICALRPNMRKLYHDMEVLLDLAGQPDVGAARRGVTARALECALNVLTDLTDERALGADYALRPELARRGGDVGFTLTAVGCASIDLARPDAARACVAAFARALGEMERCDGYVFAAGQAQAYEWVRDTAPGVYARVRERIGQGRWELAGSMWADAEQSMAGGEWLVRQLLMGKRFCARECGQDAALMWLPEGSALCAQLPQLMSRSGMLYCMSACREAPYSSFWWQGLDGTRIMTHVPPATDGEALPHSALEAARGFSEIGRSEGALMLYGGAGGPGARHMERLEREGDLMGMPPVRRERAADFFDRLRRSRVELPVWAGEPGRGMNEGALSLRADIRRLNRCMESMMRVSEIILAAMYLRGADYPHAEMNAVWRRALLCQYRALRPGCAPEDGYEGLRRECAALEEEVGLLTSARWSGEGLDVVLNPHAWTVETWLEGGEELPEGEALRLSLPPMSASSTVGARSARLPEQRADETVLENDRLRLSFDERGRLAGVLDKRQGWEVLRGAGNQLSVYADDGDELRMGEYALRQRVGAFAQESVTVERAGAVLRRRSRCRFGRSALTQTVEITAGSARVDFITEIDWQEEGRMLRAEFPLSLNGGRFLCDTQFGYAERPEGGAAALRWAALSRPGRGAALMLDGGYGCCCQDGVLSVTLLRTPSGARGQGQGRYELRYALYPHGGDMADVTRQAYQFHQPPRVRPGITFGPLCWLDAPGVVLDSVKLSEDGGDVVLRMYECRGAACAARLRTGFEAATASVCDLMERVTAPLAIDDDGIALEFGPFEIKTVILTPLARA